MFIQNLNPEQQKLLISASKAVILADGILSEEQLSKLEVLRSFCDPSLEVEDVSSIDDNFEFGDLKGKFKDKKAKVSFMLELIGMAFIDLEYVKQEKLLIRKIGDKLKLPKSLIVELEDWVQCQMQLINKANLLMEVL